MKHLLPLPLHPPPFPPIFLIQSNLYITVTLGKWPGDRYIQGDRSTQVHLTGFL